jgi:hypothetical protein
MNKIHTNSNAVCTEHGSVAAAAAVGDTVSSDGWDG